MNIQPTKRSRESLREYTEELRGSFSGEIRLDRASRALYSTDASIYQIEPLGVLLPKSADDVVASVALAAQYKIPILSRGGGTSLAGQSVGEALILDFSKYMNRIIDVDLAGEKATVQPGVVLDQLNRHLSPMGRMFGPDVSTSSRATIGGMIGNNSCGAHSIIYGKTIDHVFEMRRLVLSSGEEMTAQELLPEQWESKGTKNGHEGKIYGSLRGIIDRTESEIRQRYPKVMRRVGGYNLDALLAAENPNLCKLIVGSEGTLATYTEATIGLVAIPSHKALTVLHFRELVAAMEAVPAILEHAPAAIELMDRMLLDLTRLQPAFRKRMQFVEGDPDAVLLVEFYGESEGELRAKLRQLDQSLGTANGQIRSVHAIDPRAQADIWSIRKAGLGLLSSIRGDSKPIAFVEDTTVHTENLASYVRRFREILSRHGTQAGFYGHASVGCLHIRPLINLKKGTQVQTMADIAAAVKDLVLEFKGAMSGEHGDGLARSHWNRELFGPQLYAAFQDLKAAFDPIGIMNPGKIVNSPAMTDHLRYGSDYESKAQATHYNFESEGGFVGAVEQCNGMAACRKLDSGTMCPSYMATREEEHSTRGRANLLRAAFSGNDAIESIPDHRLLEALDLCLECKACKTECPANVDMAKIKAEFLAGYNARHGTPVRSFLLGRIAWLNKIGCALTPISNWVLHSSLLRQTVMRTLRIHPDRLLPPFASETFQRWLDRNPQPTGEDKKVVLFNDTFTNYNEPWIGRASLKLLQHAGAQVLIPPVVCCGRPMISKGLLDQAKRNALRNISLLAPLLENGAVIIGCEPSCLLTLRDEYPQLISSREAQLFADKTLLLEEYLVDELEHGRWSPRFRNNAQSLLLHGHCHQKSLAGTDASKRLLNLPRNFECHETDSGCCGMAGAFGYESEHYDISMAIGERRLFPAVRSAAPATEIVASGISCRQQIQHATGRPARHIAEVMADALD